jgi:DNA-binding CsgD family transcriptional regulator
MDALVGFDAPRLTGVVLRTRGIVERDLALIEQSIEHLDRAGARLEQAYSLIELGAALRRGGRRRESRDPLARGTDLAERCGATVLAERGATELRATGARPRRRLLTGLEALTASERRVAEMAAGGMTNRDIAQALFVTVKTVETHLGRVYRKLEVGSRAELTGLMAGSS